MIVAARFVDDQRAFAQFDRLTGEMIGSPYLLGNGLAFEILMDPEHQRFLVADLFSLQVLSLGPDGPVVDFETKFPIFVQDIGLDPVARRLYVHSTNDLAAVNLDRLMIEEPTDAADIDVELLSVPNDSAMDLDPARNRVYLAHSPQFIPVPPGAGSPPHPPVSGTMRIRILQGQPLELIDDIDTGKLGGAVGSGPFLAGTALPPTVAVPALTFAGFIMLLLAVTIPTCLAFRSSRAA